MCFLFIASTFLTDGVQNSVLVAEKSILVEGFKHNSEKSWRIRSAKSLAAHMKSNSLGKQIPLFHSPVTLLDSGILNQRESRLRGCVYKHTHTVTVLTTVLGSISSFFPSYLPNISI